MKKIEFVFFPQNNKEQLVNAGWELNLFPICFQSHQTGALQIETEFVCITLLQLLKQYESDEQPTSHNRPYKANCNVSVLNHIKRIARSMLFLMFLQRFLFYNVAMCAKKLILNCNFNIYHLSLLWHLLPPEELLSVFLHCKNQ